MSMAQISNNSTVPSNSDYQKQLARFLEEMEQHIVYENQYFHLLSHSKWNKSTYALHRANFFARTELTVKGIAHLCAQASDNSDRFTLSLFSYILNEEAGNGELENCHEVLMENAHNIYGEAEYELAPLRVQDAVKSDLIIDETYAYRTGLVSLLRGSYQRTIGVAMALESHADKMLRNLRSAFRCNRRHLDEREFVDRVEIYFNCHIDNGVEDRHAADAKRCALDNCHSLQDFTEISYGAEEALKLQNAMWQGLYVKALDSKNMN